MGKKEETRLHRREETIKKTKQGIQKKKGKSNRDKKFSKG